MDQNANIFDVDGRSFDQRVLRQSHQAPVLVDFWAAWCAPCRMLTPVLEKIVNEYDGTVVLAKVNTDTEQALAQRYGVRSLPTVVLVKSESVVDQFMGAQPESTIKRFLDPHVRRKSDTAIDLADREIGAGNTEAAMAILTEAVDTDPANDRIKLKLAEVCVENKHFERARQVLANASLETKNSAAYKNLASRIDFLEIDNTSAPLDRLVEAVQRNPKDLEARYALAVRYVVRNQFEPAMEQFLEIASRDRSFRDDAGRLGLIKVFDLLDGKGEAVTQFRHRLAKALN